MSWNSKVAECVGILVIMNGLISTGVWRRNARVTVVYVGALLESS